MWVNSRTMARNAKAAKPAKRLCFAVFARFAFTVVTR